MTTIKGQQLLEQLEWHGRTCFEPAIETAYGNASGVYFDWTVSSFTAHFKGTCLVAGFHVIPGKTQVKVPGKIPMEMDMAEIDDFPWLGVFLDGEEEPRYTFDIRQKDQDYILFSSEVEEEHTLRVVKLSEAKFSSIALKSLTVEGSFLPLAPNPKKQIEFIGDSITCGFGNMPTEANRLFFNNEENGWLAYGPVAARALGMEPACISYSGIATAKHPIMAPYGILDLYEYSERLLQDALGREPEKWDFRRKSEIVVINLGTNDGNAVKFSMGQYTGRNFEEDYMSLIRMVRRLNPEAMIICALGSMDYYLFHNICVAKEEYQQETGDERIVTFQFSGMMNLGTDVGGCMHPSKFKHAQMGAELAAFIKTLQI